MKLSSRKNKTEKMESQTALLLGNCSNVRVCECVAQILLIIIVMKAEHASEQSWCFFRIFFSNFAVTPATQFTNTNYCNTWWWQIISKYIKTTRALDPQWNRHTRQGVHHFYCYQLMALLQCSSCRGDKQNWLISKKKLIFCSNPTKDKLKHYCWGQ